MNRRERRASQKLKRIKLKKQQVRSSIWIETKVSAKAREYLGEALDLYAPVFFERSKEKYSEGLRTRELLTFKGNPITGDFLLSSYNGGIYSVITWPSVQLLFMTEELDQSSMLLERHARTSTWFGGII